MYPQITVSAQKAANALTEHAQPADTFLPANDQKVHDLLLQPTCRQGTLILASVLEHDPRAIKALYQVKHTPACEAVHRHAAMLLYNCTYR